MSVNLSEKRIKENEAGSKDVLTLFYHAWTDVKHCSIMHGLTWTVV